MIKTLIGSKTIEENIRKEKTTLIELLVEIKMRFS